MFKSFNKSTITLCCLLGFNCFMAVISIYLLVFNQAGVFHISHYGKVIISIFVVCANAYLLFTVHQRKMQALTLCFWFYLLQIGTIESESLSIGLFYGVKMGTIFDIGETQVSINIFCFAHPLFYSQNNAWSKKAIKQLKN